MAKKPFMKRLQAQQVMKKNAAVVSDIEQVIANKQPDEESHDIAAHKIMA
ncbi:chromosome partitioning protein ParB, partial [Klebsiella pneumoniae]|nr:chromosome partitioning protein ParB [Klebsiella pneumoniae]